jgi:aminomethyltransferase
MFDVSHMGEIETSGLQAQELLQRLLSNDVTKIAERGAQYSVLCREDGGVLDDLFTYRLGPERFLTVTNASNHEKDLGWFREHAGGLDVEVADAHERWAMLAVQGPEARAAVEAIAEGGLAQAPGSAGRAATALPARMRTAEVSIAGVDCLACGTGYTGEDGVELLIPPDGAAEVWDALLGRGVVPAGLGARDTLRLEVCFHLYGNDLSEDRNPIEAGLGWCCKLDTGFIGADALRGIEPEQTLVPFAFTGAGIPRQGNAVRTQHGEGVVTSGSLSPCLELGIGMAYVPVAAAEPGTELEVDVRGKPRAAEVREKPLYRKETSG